MGLEPGGVSPWGKLLLQPILKKLSVVTHTYSGLIIHRELISAVNITDCYFPLTRFWSGSYIECNEIGETISTPAHFATATLTMTKLNRKQREHIRAIFAFKACVECASDTIQEDLLALGIDPDSTDVWEYASQLEDRINAALSYPEFTLNAEITAKVRASFMS